MAKLNVNPTRMELRRLKNRLKTAVRGHKLLKDKSDEMVRQFMIYIKQNKKLREDIEEELASALNSFVLARSVTTSQQIEQALMMPSVTVNIEMNTKNVMGVDVPSLKITPSDSQSLLPYAFASAPYELDAAIIKVSSLMQRLLALAEVEKTCNMLADEIEKNRRRVNALEYVLIPQLEETIKYILMKMDENERGALVRLMKVKAMIDAREE